MPLQIKQSLLPYLPVSVQSALSKMSDEEQYLFQSEFESKMKSQGLMLALAIFFPIQLILLGKTGLWILFALTLGGCGIWWVIEIFLTPKRVKEYNQDLASQTLTNLKLISR